MEMLSRPWAQSCRGGGDAGRYGPGTSGAAVRADRGRPATGQSAGAAELSHRQFRPFSFDAFSSREPVPTPHQVRGRLSLENALDICHERSPSWVRPRSRLYGLALLDL